MVRVVAASVAVCLFAFVVITERDATSVGMVAGVLFVLLGLAGMEYLRRG